MSSLSRPLRHLRTAPLLGLVLAATLSLSGCGGSDPKDSKKPESPSSATTTAAVTSDGKPSSSAFQVIRITKYALSFEVPKSWTSLGADGVLTADNPTIKELAEKLGRTPAQVAEMMSSSLETMSLSDAAPQEGFRENVNSTGVAISDVTDAQIRSQLTTVGAKIDSLDHVDSPVGDIIRVSYALTTQGSTFRGVALGIDTGDDFVTVTISAHDEKTATDRADQVQASLKKIS